MENRQPRIRFQIFKHLVDYCSLLDIERNDLLKIAGVDESFLLQDLQYVPLEPFERMVTYLNENSKDPLWLVKFFLQNDAPTVGVLGLLMTVSSNLEEAINTGYKYRAINGYLGNIMRVEENEKYIFFKWKNTSNRLNYIKFSIEYKCSWLANFIKSIGNGREKYLRYVYFEHGMSKAGTQKYYEDFFECKVLFDQPETSLVISKEALKIPLKSANKELYLNIQNYIVEFLERYKSEERISDKVRLLIHSQLQEGMVSREMIAEKLGINVRTLTRKLNSEGSKYSVILEEIRLYSAKNYLKNSSQPILDIAKNLGFFTSNSFITWFKSLTGETPKKYRDIHKGDVC